MFTSDNQFTSLLSVTDQKPYDVEYVSFWSREVAHFFYDCPSEEKLNEFGKASDEISQTPNAALVENLVPEEIIYSCKSL